jgi:hypothetical protein
MQYSLTIFKSIYDNKVDKRMDFSTWDKFEKLLYDLSSVKKSSKRDAQLISPAIYLPDTTRANKSVESWAGWAALDIDDHEFKGNLKNELITRFGHIYFVCYSTASSTIDKPKFRIVFPLKRHVEANKIKSFWFALNTEFGNLGDTQTKDMSRMYYVPADYAGANNFIFTNKSDSIIDPSKLIEKHPHTQKQGKTFIERLPDNIQKEIVKYRAETLESNKPNVQWSSYRDCPFVNQNLIKEYKSINSSGWYFTMYRIMVSVAATAIRRGYPISSHEITILCQELDLETGSWYQGRPLEVEADRAIEFAYRNA